MVLLTSENHGELHEVVKGTEERHQLEEYSSNAGIAEKALTKYSESKFQVADPGYLMFLNDTQTSTY